MSETHMNQDEVVFVDGLDGLEFTRADRPSHDYPEGARVCSVVNRNAEGTVVSPGKAARPSAHVDPDEWAPVLWDTQDRDGPAYWVRVSALKLV